ncbi:MAG: right-handed parallel beta-helix repeat-containing protein [Thermoplasmata archaeon]
MYVGNTTVYFSIRRCYIHNITGIEIDTQKGVAIETWVSNSGIGLFNVQNFILENNIVSNTQWEGILMHRVMDGSVNNNTVSRARNAIRLSDSENVYVGNNEIENYIGINVSNSSNNNTVTKNSVTGLDNSRGVGIGLSSSNNYINNNTISTYRYGIGADAEETNFIDDNIFLNIGDEEIFREYGEEQNGNDGDTPFLGFAFFTIAILVAGSIWKQRKRI